jgi:AraC-like DNA-binding protein
MVRRTKQVIDERFHQGDSIKEMLSRLSASPTVLSRHFKRVYGLTPVAYRNKLRVMRSLWLLLSEDYSSINAGHASGFHNLSAFYRQFKRVNKSHPSEYRFH